MAAKAKRHTKRSNNSPRNGARRRSSSASSSGAKDAIALLKSDHQAVSKLFDAFEDGKNRMSDTQKRQIAMRICQELTIHAQIEEEIFYPAVRENMDEAAALLDEAEVEHASVKQLVAQIEAEGTMAELFAAKVKVLGEYVKHHVKEEEGELFPKVRKSDPDLRELGDQMSARKAALMGERSRLAA